MAISTRFLPLLIILTALVVGGAIIASAQADIEYPVAELGNCENKTECQAYCDDPTHIEECLAFAEEHNLLSQEEIERGRAFAGLLASGTTPGGCSTEQECEAYCSDTTQIQECLAFAEENGFLTDEELREIRAIAGYLEGGGALPGGCTSEAACEAYCSDLSHMDECLAFAEEVGFIPPDELEEAQKVREYLSQGGVLPGGCRTKGECEAYCEAEGNFAQCIDFAAGAGFISAEEAEIARKTGGKGPGGCRGEGECREYCNNPANQEACFAFAKEHGLLSEDDLADIREGTARIKEGLREASPEVLACLNEGLGPDVVAELQSGDFTPSHSVGEVMMRCFEEFGPGADEVIQALDRASPEVLSCIESHVGAERIAHIKAGDMSALNEELGDVIQQCFAQFGFGPEHDEGGGGPGGGEGGGLKEAFESAAPEVLGCIQTEIGYDLFVQVREGDYSNAGPEVGDALRVCYEQFGQQAPEGFNEEEFQGAPPEEFQEVPDTSSFAPSFDPSTEDCLKKTFGDGFKELLVSSELSEADIEAAVRQCFEEQLQPHVPEVQESFDETEVYEDFDSGGIPTEGDFQSIEFEEGTLITPQALLANPLLLFYYLLLPQ